MATAISKYFCLGEFNEGSDAEHIYSGDDFIVPDLCEFKDGKRCFLSPGTRLDLNSMQGCAEFGVVEGRIYFDISDSDEPGREAWQICIDGASSWVIIHK